MPNKRKKKRIKESNKIMKEIHKRVKQLGDEKLDKQLAVIKAYKNDSSKYFRP